MADPVIDPLVTDRDITAPALAAPGVFVSMDSIVGRAISLVAGGDAPAGARLVADALASAPPGNAGWQIPIEPLLGVQRNRAAWANVVVELRTRSA